MQPVPRATPPGLNAGAYARALYLNAHMPVLPWRVWYIWTNAEGEPGASHNNPLNIPYYDFLAPYGATNLGDALAGTAAFPSAQQGVTATLHALDGTLPFAAGIEQIFPAARAHPGDAYPMLLAIQNSPWAASHYNFALVEEYVQAFGLPLPRSEWGH